MMKNTKDTSMTEFNAHTDALERYDLETFIYEGYKDAYGVKGRHYNFADMSLEELKEEAQRINDAVCDEIEREKRMAKLCVEEFNARVEEVITVGAGDRETALRWMATGEGQSYYGPLDIEHWVWEQGILFTDEGAELVKELKKIITYSEIDY